jgi:rfaE bifunctional protein kinase chain/domain
VAIRAATELDRLAGRTVWVLGDALLDRYVFAEPERLSREAPLPVFLERSVEERPGGAANAALNLAALGARVELVAPLGADPEGRRLRELLEARGIGVSRCTLVPERRTLIKTRVLAAEAGRTPVQVLRLDRPPGAALPQSAEAALVRQLGRGPAPDLILASDYGQGAVGAASLAAARRLGPALVLDPRRLAGLEPGFLAATPNLPELAQLCGRPTGELSAPGALEAAARTLAERHGIEHLLVTLGNRGMALFSAGEPASAVPASGAERVVDASGAGDAAAATFGLCLAAGLEPRRAMELANAAAGLVVMQLGAAPVARLELEAALARCPRASALPAALLELGG